MAENRKLKVFICRSKDDKPKIWLARQTDGALFTDIERSPLTYANLREFFRRLARIRED
jgi:hypothetical protein